LVDILEVIDLLWQHGNTVNNLFRVDVDSCSKINIEATEKVGGLHIAFAT